MEDRQQQIELEMCHEVDNESIRGDTYTLCLMFKQYAIRRHIPLFSSRIHNHVLRWLIDLSLCCERRRAGGADEESGIHLSPTCDNVFFFSYEEIIGRDESNHQISPVITNPFGFSCQVREQGFILQDIVTMMYCFVGKDHLLAFVNLCRDVAVSTNQPCRAFPPLLSQVLDHQHASAHYRRSCISAFMYFKHFSHWFNTFRDTFEVPEHMKNTVTIDSQIHKDGVFRFSETQSMVHATLLVLMVIDFMFYHPFYRTGGSALEKLIDRMESASPHTLYLHVKYLFGYISELPESTSLDRTEGLSLDMNVIDYPTPSIRGGRDEGSKSSVNPNPYIHLALQIVEVVRWILKRLFQWSIDSPSDKHIHQNKQLDSMWICNQLHHDVRLVMRPFDFDRLCDSGIEIFRLMRGNLTHLFRMYMNTHLCVTPFRYTQSCGIGGMATSASIERLPGGLSVSQDKEGEGEGDLPQDLDDLYEGFQKGFILHGSHIEGEQDAIYEAERKEMEDRRDPKSLQEGVWGLITPPRGGKTRRNSTGKSGQSYYPYCTDTSLLGRFQYHHYDNSSLELEIPRQRYNGNSVPVPRSISRIVATSIIARKKVFVDEKRWDLEVSLQMRIFVLVSIPSIKAVVDTGCFDESRDIYLDLVLTHLSISDILFTLTFYQKRFPFMTQESHSLSYTHPEVCILRLPAHAKQRIQTYVPVWMHYQQISPQPSIMTPLLFHNYLLAIQTSDIAGMLTVAESIHNLVAGNEERLVINPRLGTMKLWDGRSISKGYPDFEYSTSFESSMYLKHMATLPIFISSIDYNVALTSPYKDILNFVSSTSSKKTSNPSSDDTFTQATSFPYSRIPIETDGDILHFHPFVPTIFSAIRSFLNITSIHLLSLDVFGVIVHRFMKDPFNALKYPAQSYLIRYLQSIGQNSDNIIQFDDGRRIGENESFHVTRHQSFLIIPPYYDPALLSPSLSRMLKVSRSPYRATPLIVQFYPLISLIGETPAEMLEFMLGVRIYNELKGFPRPRADLRTTADLNDEQTSGNFIPPSFAFKLFETEGHRFAEIFQDHVRQEEMEKDSNPPLHQLLNPTLPVHRSFYHFLYYMEIQSHFPCIGVNAMAASRDITNGNHHAFFTPAPFHSKDMTNDISHSSFRGATSVWNAIPQINKMLPFNVFLETNPSHPIWEHVFNEYIKTSVIDRTFFSHVDPLKYAQAAARNIPFSSLPSYTKDAKNGWVDESKERLKNYLFLNVSPDNDLGVHADRVIFPILSSSFVSIDPTNIRNEDGPLFGADPFIPFALGIEPITHISTVNINLR